MHRVRQSLSYFAEAGWEPVTLAVDPNYVEGYVDEHLLKTIPEEADVRRLPALYYHWTRRLGLASSPSARSGPTAALATPSSRARRHRSRRPLHRPPFQVLVPARYRKARSPCARTLWICRTRGGSDHYLSVPRDERPPKFWLSYLLLQPARTGH